MSNACPTSDLFIPDPDIGNLAESIRSLYVAILNRAIKDIFKPTYSDHEIYRNQALYWIAVDDLESITSFVNICNHLDIDVDNFRNILNVELGRIERGLPHRIKFSVGNHTTIKEPSS
ncbi:hypothetical protein DSCW_63080 [Desulfosarcina widdelii]|uniref:Uncharacterized protein n=1 Tax=Desulfosarcina widdelii TaxID=947919 RepID=A0A5K7ZGI7_9BACT|nr:hypothetical protein [Desulfosarcina widdelii]BBO78891.1 hypothetical protein DSCW_63080 [Desulfosarcina widdelii]